jgi:hypothetical protein
VPAATMGADVSELLRGARAKAEAVEGVGAFRALLTPASAVSVVGSAAAG